jgi:glyoxylase-like metal-dependent hydrolase (beta-lactamase superfamily II)
MHTPGHTPGHLSYVLSESDGEPAAVFTGGSMLFGAVGRTDLIGPDQTAPAGSVPPSLPPILGRAGRQVIHIDDDWSRATELGLPITS